MAAPPARDDISGSGATPSNGQARTGFGKLYDYLIGLLGLTGNASDARDALGIGSVITFRNLLINSNFSINQRGYVSGTATGTANQYTLDRWRVVTSGQNISFGSASPDRIVTAPAGGMEQVIEGAAIEGGVYTLSWAGTATATVNGAAITNGGNTAALTAGANVTVRFTGGTVDKPQFERGTKVTPYERRPPGLELLLAQRYYEVGQGEVSGNGPTGIEYASRVHFKATKRATPTVTSAIVSSVNATVLDITAVDANVARVRVQPLASGGFIGVASYTASAEL
ncbi:hypothetical protein [Variovorax atrisoli]|uniref:hypothetical protein n=1 Tax=Variovorax atrisoli TaxID=3394203 RepID=UPI001621F770|nr:hypothetical protein [Variovorax sp. BK613]MBB3639788.1 hypothetical protein [Variovorax sp. BK613]